MDDITRQQDTDCIQKNVLGDGSVVITLKMQALRDKFRNKQPNKGDFELFIDSNKEIKTPSGVIPLLCFASGPSIPAFNTSSWWPRMILKEILEEQYQPVREDGDDIVNLVTGRSKLQDRMYAAGLKVIHGANRYGANLWNAIWRRALPHLDHQALKASRIMVGPAGDISLYNYFVTNPMVCKAVVQSPRLIRHAIPVGSNFLSALEEIKPFIFELEDQAWFDYAAYVGANKETHIHKQMASEEFIEILRRLPIEGIYGGRITSEHLWKGIGYTALDQLKAPQYWRTLIEVLESDQLLRDSTWRESFAKNLKENVRVLYRLECDRIKNIRPLVEKINKLVRSKRLKELIKPNLNKLYPRSFYRIQLSGKCHLSLSPCFSHGGIDNNMTFDMYLNLHNLHIALEKSTLTEALHTYEQMYEHAGKQRVRLPKGNPAGEPGSPS